MDVKLNSLLVLLAIAAIAYGQVAQGGPHQSQGGPHQNQGRIRRQAPQNNEYDDVDNLVETVQPGPPQWVSCNFTIDPKISCADCNTRLICKPIGGLLRSCNNPYKPHCNAGICSAVPSAECA